MIRLLLLANEYFKQKRSPKELDATPAEIMQLNATTTCVLCHRAFDCNKRVKCKDHCHFTGKLRGATCAVCNGKAQLPSYVPVGFHNLQGYDGHVLLKAIQGLRNPDGPWADHPVEAFEEDIEDRPSLNWTPPTLSQLRFDVIPNTAEKSMSIRLGPLRFFDTNQFLKASLGALIELARWRRRSRS